MHIDEIQNTLIANDLIKSSGRDVFTVLIEANPELASQIIQISELFNRTMQILIGKDGVKDKGLLKGITDGTVLCDKGKYVEKIEGGRRGDHHVLSPALQEKAWERALKDPVLSRIHKQMIKKDGQGKAKDDRAHQDRLRELHGRRSEVRGRQVTIDGQLVHGTSFRRP